VEKSILVESGSQAKLKDEMAAKEQILKQQKAKIEHKEEA